MKTRTICPICGRHELVEEIGEFRAEFVDEHGSKQHVVVPDVRKLKCANCGEYILDTESEQRISEAQRHALGRLTARELQDFRTSLGYSQEEMSELLGLGKKTYCRWESDDYIQSEAFDRFLRLVMFTPSIVRALDLIRVRKSQGVSSMERLAETFPNVRDIPATEILGRHFGSVLSRGVFSVDQEVTCTR